MALTSCGGSLVIDGVKYRPYGLLNRASEMDDRVRYEPIWGNVIWGAVFLWTYAVPIYFYGFSVMEPVGLKHDYNLMCVEEDARRTNGKEVRCE